MASQRGINRQRLQRCVTHAKGIPPLLAQMSEAPYYDESYKAALQIAMVTAQSLEDHLIKMLEVLP